MLTVSFEEINLTDPPCTPLKRTAQTPTSHSRLTPAFPRPDLRAQMAEVLSPLHTRSSTSDQYQPGMSTSNGQSGRSPPPTQRGQYNNHSGSSGYRGTSAPVAPYAFKATPNLRTETRTNPSPASPSTQPLASDNSSAANRQRYPATASVSTTSSSGSSNPPSLPPLTKDDSGLFSSFQMPTFDVPEENGIVNENEVPKPFPDRYRRTNRRVEANVTSQPIQAQKASVFEGMTASGVFGTGKLSPFQYNPQQLAAVSPSPTPPLESEPRLESTASGEKADVPRRYRRRTSSGNAMEAGVQTPPGSRSGPTSPNEGGSPVQSNGPPPQEARPASSNSGHRPTNSSSSRNEHVTRSFTSADAVRRINNPSPLSRPMSPNAPNSPNGTVPQISSPYSPNPTISQSPAVAAMAALNVNDKENKLSKSRLRRAFSFGSSAELRRVTETNQAVDRAKARQEQFSNELDDEQIAIARKQEASGLGNSIYSGQGGVFTGSTDNLSISSTASSASLMLRKMGKGMKKGARSMKGLFRPKSVIGVPAADGPSQASTGQVTMVTVEAEREQVNVNADPHDQAGGGTGFPRLERNSVDAARASTPMSGDNRDPRRSVMGGEQERQEVLNAVKRGILKRAGTSSPVGSPTMRPGDGSQERLPTPDRVGSPALSTTSSEPRRTGHRRTDSHTLDGDDYFANLPRLPGNQSSRSLPGTPRTLARNISFSPRLQFHDAWSSTEYDRRGDIATCNRLTPMLAQQIKEELNNFKMEMEVHELSKTHTHFF